MKNLQEIEELIRLYTLHLEHLESMRKEMQKKNKQVKLEHGMCNLTGLIHKNTGRVSIVHNPGDTALSFTKRKPETFRSIGEMLIQLADQAEEEQKKRWLDFLVSFPQPLNVRE